MIAGSLEIQLMANVARLQKDMADAKRLVGGAMGDITKAVDHAKNALEALGVGLSVGAFAHMVKGAIDAADNLNDLSKTTRIAIADLNGLKLAANQSGGDLEGIAASVNKLATNMGKDAEKFKALGITAKDPLKALEQFADVFSAIEDPQLRAALGAEALGKSWQSAAPLLSEGGTKIAEMVERGKELAGVTQQMADEADEFNDKLAELGVSSDAFKAGIAGRLLPMLNVLADEFKTTKEQAGSLSGSFDPITETFRALVILGGNVAFTFRGVGKEIGGIAAQLALAATGDFAGASRLHEVMVRDAEDARTAFDAWEKKILEVGTAAAATGKTVAEASASVTALSSTFGRDWNALSARYAQGKISVDELTKAQAKLLDMQSGKVAAEAAAKAAAFVKQNEEAVKQAAEAAKKETALLAELSGLSGSFMADWNALSAVYAKGAISLDQLTKAQADLLAKQPGIKAAADAEIKAREELAKFNEQYAKGLAQTSNMMEKSIEDATREAEQNEDLARTFGMTKSAIEAMELARLEDQLAQRSSLGLTADEIEALKKLIDAKRRSVAALGSVEAKEADKKAADDLAAEYKRASEQIGQSLTDNLMRGGKSAAEYLKDLFRTLVLRPILAPIGTAVGGALTSLTMPGMAQAAGSSAGSSASGSMLGAATGSLFGAGGMAGSLAAGAGWLTGATTLGGSLAAGASLVGTGTMAGFASGMGMIAGAMGPIALGLAAAYALYKSVDHSGTPHTGGAASASSAGVSTIAAESLHFEKTATSAKTEQWVSGLAQGIVSILDSTALAFGKTAGYTAATAFADDSSKDGAWGGLVISKLGAKLIDWQDSRGNGRWAPKLFADGEEGQKQYLAAISADVRTALDGIGLPAWAQKMLDGLGKDAGLDEMAKVIDAINATQTALKAMGDQLVGFSSMSEGAVSALMAAAGGIQNLAAGASAYYDNFYSDAEKNASVTKQLGEALASVGLSLPSTRDEFRALVEAQMALGEAGAPAVATLFGVADAFAKLHPQIEATTDAIKDQAQTMRDQASTLLGDVDNAFSVLQRVTQRSIDTLTARIDKEKALSDAIKSTLNSMRAQGSEAADRATAQAQLRTMTAIAKAGGPLPSVDALQKVLSTVSQDASSQFATREDYLRDFYRTQNDIASLGDVTDKALSVDQRSLDALTGMLDKAQQQIDILKGIDVIGLTIAQALAGFQTAMVSAKANPVISATSSIAGMYQSLLGRAPDAAGLAYWQDKAASGLSMDAISKFFKESAEYRDKHPIPGFINGGNFAGGVRMVGEVGPEVEATGPSRIHSTRDLISALRSPSESNSVLAAAVERLTATVERQQQALDQIQRNTRRQADTLDVVTEGGNAMRTA